MRSRTCLRVVTIALVVWVSACGSCDPPAQRDSSTATDAIRIATGKVAPEGDAREHKPVPPVLPEATLVGQSGQVAVERSESTLKMPALADFPDFLFVGDSVSTGDDGSADLDVGQNTKMSLGPSTSVTVGIHRPLEIVLHVGTISLSGDPIGGFTRRFMVMTPGALVFYAGPDMGVAVASSGEVRVDVRDCPLRELAKAAKAKVPDRPIRARCGYIGTGEEQDLVTGDRILIGPDLEVQKTKLVEDEGLEAWANERAESLADDPEKIVDAYLAWTETAQADVRTFIDEIKTRRERNKELIRKLRDLRKAGKPDPSKKAAGSVEGDSEKPTSEIAEVKLELTNNSSEQYRLRHLLLARWYQLSLYLALVEPLLVQEGLAPLGKKLPKIQEAVEGLGAEVLELFSRKVRRQHKPKFMPKNFIGKEMFGKQPKKPYEKQ